jgi:hypothetical protein
MVGKQPFMQTSRGPQVTPQAPQFLRSVLVLTQAPLHSVSPAAQPLMHCPFKHASEPRHALPQPPQFIGSTRGSTQALPQVS